MMLQIKQQHEMVTIIENLGNPENPQDSTNKRYDDQLILVTHENINSKVLLDGTTTQPRDITGITR